MCGSDSASPFGVLSHIHSAVFRWQYALRFPRRSGFDICKKIPPQRRGSALCTDPLLCVSLTQSGYFQQNVMAGMNSCHIVNRSACPNHHRIIPVSYLSASLSILKKTSPQFYVLFGASPSTYYCLDPP